VCSGEFEGSGLDAMLSGKEKIFSGVLYCWMDLRNSDWWGHWLNNGKHEIFKDGEIQK
jgi:hypothetical protein